MKTTLGGDRLGSGKKQQISMRNYERSTHDLSYIWRSTMSTGTLVPFMSQLALPGDKMDIDLRCEVLTLPTIGPLFGSAKVQLDVFKVPIRLYQAKLHMNMLNIGLEMDKILLPQVAVPAIAKDTIPQTYGDNDQIGSSCILKYLGISGVGNRQVPTVGSGDDVKYRHFNGVPLLAYWDIFKQYYSNKQEEQAWVIHNSLQNIEQNQETTDAYIITTSRTKQYILDNEITMDVTNINSITIIFKDEAVEPDPEDIKIIIGGNVFTLPDLSNEIKWVPKGEGEDRLTRDKNKIVATYTNSVLVGSQTIEMPIQSPKPNDATNLPIALTKFDLENIDKMRMNLLSAIHNVSPVIVNNTLLKPYNLLKEYATSTNGDISLSIQGSQEGLAVKTYQSDLFNNWIDTEWIDGDNGINAITSVDTTGDSFTLDAFNLASKVYVMLNRIAISGGTYDDWLQAVYTNDRKRGTENPVYLGGLIRELAFEEVISNADTNENPLGTLAGRGKLTPKNKGGKITVEVDEPSYIMGIVSITPRIDYSQGNKWDMNLKTLDDLHKPALDGIGFQDLITDQMHWADTNWNAQTETVTFKSAGKQPAWINYMTEVNRCYGNFAEENKEMFMTFNRKYEVEQDDSLSTRGSIKDLTTYIDPTKYNNIFAETKLDAQNYWVQIGVDNTARRKMSAKIIPNL